MSFAACTASSLILCRIEWVSFSAPSAVWIRDIPSCAFRDACSNPRICALIFSLIANPAASSAARLILKPVDNRSSERPISVLINVLFLQAFNAGMLW
ncbi:MAG: hypothetical protein BWX67_02347 [Thermotogae bacterium ADurb.Bin062]|nr:MAG: hypothetical protein BWX67_02347 [Thermotogota bacterium ADurb.Bin062]